MKSSYSHLIARTIWLMALSLMASAEASDDPIRIEIAAAGKVRVGSQSA